ncbi:MAG: TadE/TadG family type IV pilus assembly protein, partial [Hyphomicrobium sp.]
MSQSLKLSSQRFLGDRRGNVAMIFGLMAIPVFGIVGTAIDYGRAAKAKQELQSLVDGAALAATSEYTKTGDSAAATNRLRSFVNDGLTKHSLSLLPPAQPGQTQPTLGSDPSKVLLENAEFSAESATVNPKLTSRVETTILALLNQPYFEVQAETKAGLAGKKLELSMMLDITGSMCDSGNSCSTARKLDAMKNAANDLVGIVFTGNSTNTRMAVIPFSSAVNVGSHADGATGQPATKPYTYKCGYKNRSTCTGTQYRTNCVTERTGANKSLDNAPGAGDYSQAMWSTSSSATCTPSTSASLLPLTNTRTELEAKIA